MNIKKPFFIDNPVRTLDCSWTNPASPYPNSFLISLAIFDLALMAFRIVCMRLSSKIILDPIPLFRW